ncbi:MAG: hypothetical protein K2H60_01150 [Muribaculaceae bacterium]|nr:hypothetical protein [Muribaculaceae bacterium]
MKTIRFFAAAACMALMASCGGGAKENSTASEKAVDDDAFYATQPVVSGQYRAVSYDIIGGANPRKGKFDGRLLISLSPTDPSGMYVYENGNRTKIDYKIVLKTPFEKGDSGVYKTLDVNDLPVTISSDSIGYVLSFEKNSGDKQSQIKIGFEKEPMSTGSALEMMERITTALQKNK